MTPTPARTAAHYQKKTMAHHRKATTENTLIKLYYHKTDGGAEYLFDTFLPWTHNGKSGKEGVVNAKTKYIVRIDGDITIDAELTVRGQQ